MKRNMEKLGITWEKLKNLGETHDLWIGKRYEKDRIKVSLKKAWG